MLSNIVRFITDILEQGIMAFFFINYFESKKGRIVTFYGVTLSFVLFYYILEIFTTIVVKIMPKSFTGITIFNFFSFLIIILFYLASISIWFKMNFLKKIITTINICVIDSIALLTSMAVIASILGPNEYNSYFDGEISKPISLSIAHFIFFSFFLTIYFKLFEKTLSKKTNKNKLMLLIYLVWQIFCIYSIVKIISYIFVITDDWILLLPEIVLLCSLPIISTICFYYFLHISNKRHGLELKAEYTEYLITQQSQYLSEIIEQNSLVEKLKHDFNTHSKILSELAGSGKYDELKSYLNEFTGKYSLDSFTFCSRGAVNAILSQHYKSAKKHGIDLQILFDTDGTENISNIELCSVVSNILKNAIEACENIKENKKRYIRLSAGEKADYFIITQENTSQQPNADFKTTKSDAKNHGIGLIIIDEIAKKYDGSAVFEYNDGVFKSMVMLKK